MNKQMNYWLTLGFTAIAYHVIAFGVPFERNNCFYISWAFTLAAFAVEIYVLNTVFFTGGDVKRLVYGLPVARIGSLYLILQILLGFVFMGVGTRIEVPLWIPIVLFAVMLCIAGELLTAVTGARNAALYQDNTQTASTAHMRNLQTRIMLIAASASQKSGRQ